MAIKGLPDGAKATIGELAERLQLKHHSTVELVNRLEKLGSVARQASKQDRRQVIVHLTHSGASISDERKLLGIIGLRDLLSARTRNLAEERDRERVLRIRLPSLRKGDRPAPLKAR